MKKNFKIALVGNPNSGKTTLFNHLTGFRQKIGNYPGVTVEKKEGIKKTAGFILKIVDLPGVYSLSAQSEEEKIARDFILNEKPDVIINIVDSSRLEKSLYLTTELKELNIPVVLALNMIDILEKQNTILDLPFLEKKLQLKAKPLVAHKKIGIKSLLKEVISHTAEHTGNDFKILYSPDIENAIGKLEHLLDKNISKDKKRFFALKALENEEDLIQILKNENLKIQSKQYRSCLEKKYRDHLSIIFAKKRHIFIKDNIGKNLFIKDTTNNFSDKLDKVLTHKIFGLPIFFAVMYLIFQMTFSLSAYPTQLISNFFSFIKLFISTIWPVESYNLFRSLVIDGIISGVGSVLVFLPNIMLLFLSISILEESGYMARIAFILDKAMHRIGLHGKSFIPMLLGFGCSVPAIFATRTLDSKKERLAIIFSLPLISCSAKLVVYTLIIPAFFPTYLQPVILFVLYVFGIVLSIGLIKILKLSIFKEKAVSFFMEYPTYKMPNFKTLFFHMWDRSKEYVKKAGSLILAFSVVIWFLSAFPKNNTEKQDFANTYIAKVGKTIEPVFKPIGFDWKINSSLISSFAAKEVFIAQLGIIYSVNHDSNKSLQEEIKKDYNYLQAISIMLFILISTPCIATFAATRKETNSYMFAVMQYIGLTVLAYLVSLIFYQIGVFLIR